MLISILSVILLALFAPLLHSRMKDRTGYLLALLPFGIFVYFLTLYPTITGGEIVRSSLPWLSSLGINLSFLLDGLSYLFVLLITGMGTFIVLYASGYMKGHSYLGRFYLALLLFMASMLGVVLSDNLITLFVFWELTSFTSFMLIGFNHESPESRKSALQALLVTFGGGLALLAGVVLMGIAGGTMEISEILSSGDLIRNHGLYLPILILFLLGAFTKSAQFPFHFWLPNAMEAPTPVSAYLHSATMVKAGIYLLARISPALGGTDIWIYVVTIIGAFTMVSGAWMALRYTDLKQVLAYSTLMALGTLTMLLGMGYSLAFEAVVLFILVHSLYKGALFMVAGTLDHETGTRDYRRLGGLGNYMPITAVGAVLAALSMSGVVPFVGFIAKELVYEAALNLETASSIMIFLAVLANIAGVAAAGIAAIRPFFGTVKEPTREVKETNWTLWIGPLLLGATSLILGLFPAIVDETLISSSVSAISGETVLFELSIWHGFNMALLLSILTLAVGVLVYLYLDTLRESKALQGFTHLFGRLPEKMYDSLFRLVDRVSILQTSLLQSGYLRYYLGIIITVLVILVGVTHMNKGIFYWPGNLSEVLFYEWVLLGLILVATYTALFAKTGMGAIASLAMSGFSITLLFVLNSAPDLALTQLLVETLTVILFALALMFLPRLKHEPVTKGIYRDVLISVSAGVLLTMLILGVLSFDLDPYISEFYAENSYLLANGRNIVNVILVDFRAFDTMGEITVLSVAGLGIYALLKLNKRPDTEEETP